MPVSALPLYAPLGFFNRTAGFHAPSSAHPGLLFDRYIDGWNIPADGATCQVAAPAGRDSPGGKREFYQRVIAAYAANAMRADLARAHAQLALLIRSLDGVQADIASSARFVSGLGTGHPFEAGFIFHRTLGVPYLLGSSVKGLIRAWATLWGGGPEAEVERLFGPPAERDRLAAGSVIVFDALPVTPPAIELDVMNPHYGKYYGDATGATPPADYLEPKPVFFLATGPGAVFRFSLAARRRHEQAAADVARASELLGEALATLGAGAKTAVGYGLFAQPTASSAPVAKVDAPAPSPMKVPSRPVQQVWVGMLLTLNPGNRILTASGSGRKAERLTVADDPILQSLTEAERKKLTGKGLTCDVVVEPQGNAWRIVSIAPPR